MACEALITGQRFLASTLGHIDCQARTVGAYGYGALAQPGSVVSVALTSLLTVFIALFGIRLLMGEPIGRKDVIGDVLRIGIVLSIASSWPAWRTVAYDLVLDGPAQVARTVGLASGLPGSSNDMIARLQNADDGIVAITVYGSGRLTGDVAAGTDIGDSPRGIALSDQFALGMGRTLFLSVTIGSVALVRVGAGILLAIAPLMAGLLFFQGTAAIFFGWLRALTFCALGNIALLIVQGAELALLYPWMSNVLVERTSRVFTPSAPTELLVLALAFSILTVGLLFLTGKLTFMPRAARLWIKPQAASRDQVLGTVARPLNEGAHASGDSQPSRAMLVSQAVAHTMRREEGAPTSRIPNIVSVTHSTNDVGGAGPQAFVAGPSDALGSSFKRGNRRASPSAQRRDNR